VDPLPLANGITQALSSVPDASQSELPLVDNFGIWDDWQAFTNNLDNPTELQSMDAGFTTQLTSDAIAPYSNSIFPLNSFADSEYPIHNGFPNPLDTSVPNSFLDNPSAIAGTPLTINSNLVVPNGPTADVVVNTNVSDTTLPADHDDVHSVDPLHPIMNMDTPNGDGDSQSLNGVASMQVTSKRAPTRRNTAAAKENHEKGAESAGAQESQTERMTASGEGSNDKRNRRKRKETANPADDEGLADGRCTRRKVVLPSHLQEIGYKAPKKGMRPGKNADKWRDSTP
jgi:hypothetical protein